MEKNISPEHSKIILTEMCKRVGADCDSFDFSKPNWFLKHTWTEEEQDDFRVWLGKYLIKNKIVRKGKYKGQDNGYYQAGKIVFNYGWKTKHEKNNRSKNKKTKREEKKPARNG